MVSLKLEVATPEDATAITRIYFLAFTDELAVKLFPRTEGVAQWRTETTRRSILENPLKRVLKIVDTDEKDPTDESKARLVAYAEWYLPEDPTSSSPIAPRKAKNDWPEDCDAEFNDKFFEALADKRKEHMDSKRYYLLSMLATEPNYQHMGAGSQLTKYGLALADKDELPTWVESTPMALPYYQHFGWEKVDEYAVFSGRYITTCMVRPHQFPEP